MLNGIEFDQDAIDNGRWTPLLDSQLKIASMDSKKFKDAVYNLDSQFISDDQFCELLAEHILVGWVMVKDPDGYELPYSKDFAKIALMTNEPLKLFVDSFSRSIKNYASAS